MDHYFTDNRHLARNRRGTFFRFWCLSVSLITDNGVSSKDSIGFGTWVLLDTLHKHEEELGDQPLDMGYDYGVMGIITEKVWPDKQVETVDVNPRTVELVRDSAEKDDIEANIHVSDVYEQVSGNTFTDIVTNPPTRAGKNVIYNIFEEVWNHLADQGTLRIVIRKQQGARSAAAEMKEMFGNCDIIHKEKGYFILRAKKVLAIWQTVDIIINCIILKY